MEDKNKKKYKLFIDIKKNLIDKDLDELYVIFKEYKDSEDISRVKTLKKILDDNLINYGDNKLIKNEILKIIKKCIDDIQIDTEENYNYPDYNNKDFINKINNKVEFNSLVVENTNKSACSEINLNYFELSPYQIFLKNFFTTESPYKSLLIYHGTGVGKTCSGVSVAENFTDNNIEIIILASPNIINNWKNTILNIEKDSNQCTSNKYIDQYKNQIQDKSKSKERIKKKIINNNYKFYGYIEFTNMIIKYINNNTPKNITEEEYKIYEKKLIDNYFNNKLLIIDEVHNIRTEKEKLSRNILNVLHKVVRYSNSMRLLVLSATPMYNSSFEIIWLLNLLLLNDNRPEITENEIFKNGKVTKEGIDILNKKCKGYISYVRGNDPITFPYRLYPTINKNTRKFIINKFPTKNPFNEDITEKNKITYLKNKLYGCKFNEYQKNIYNTLIKDNPNNKKIYDNQLEEASIISFPLLTDNLKHSYGSSGLNKCFTKTNGIYSYNKNIVKKYGYFLNINEIDKYSTKFSLLLNTIKNTKGIIFIFSRYIEGSIVPLMLALEENGFNRYRNENLLDREKRKITKISYDGYTEEECKKLNIPFKQAKYIDISGISKNNKENLEILNSPKNKYGEEIKIIIGSEVTKEGIDMKRIREIHIMEPWYHLNRTEQIIGRGIRYCSHKDLNKNEKNTTIYLYASYDSLEIESSDIYKYRRAELKSKEILKIENVLQKNAIDCSIFKNINEIDESKLKDEDIETSQKIGISKNGKNKYQIIQNYNPYKKQYFNLLCSDFCNYKCNKIKSDKTIDISTINHKHIDNIFKLVYKYIASLFKKKLMYKLDTIIEILKLYINIDKRVLYLCLDKMINEKILIQNKDNINGYLIYKNELYIFQPENLLENTPYYYRNKLVKNEIEYIDIKIKEKQKLIKTKSVKKYKTDEIKIKQDFNKIKNKINKIFKSINYDFDWLDDTIKLEYSIDKLNHVDKIHLLYYILINNSEYVKYDNKDIIKNYFTQNFIYYKKGNYYINNDKYIINPNGFYLSKDNIITYYLYEKGNIIEADISDKKDIEDSVDIDLLKEYLEEIMLYDTFSYGYYNIKNKVYDLKIKNLNKSRSKDKLGCRICNSNDYKKSDVQEYIINSIDNNIDFKKIKTKIDMCNYIEFVLRHKTKIENKNYYINIDNILLSEFVLNKL
tara:strand:- start:2726 stop:6271 length:3546 start_codon:yes stop_codon:yes gene_type:complete